MKTGECVKILLGDQEEWGDLILVPGAFMRTDLETGVSFEDCVKEGAITTVEMYKTGQMSMAHLFQDGEIRRYNQVIGTIKEIKFLDPIKINHDEDAFSNLLGGAGL